MTGTPTTKKDKMDVVVKGQYATSNKRFFKGRAITKNDNILDVSVYAEKEITDKELEKALLAVTFSDLPKSSKLKPKK